MHAQCSTLIRCRSSFRNGKVFRHTSKFANANYIKRCQSNVRLSTYNHSIPFVLWADDTHAANKQQRYGNVRWIRFFFSCHSRFACGLRHGTLSTWVMMIRLAPRPTTITNNNLQEYRISNVANSPGSCAPVHVVDSSRAVAHDNFTPFSFILINFIKKPASPHPPAAMCYTYTHPICVRKMHTRDESINHEEKNKIRVER